MPSTFTQNLGIEQPATGEQAGTWGVTANTSYATIDVAIMGNMQIGLSASLYQLTTGQGGTAQNGDYPLIVWTGTLAAQGTVQIQPNSAQKRYIMRNQTGGGYGVAFEQGTGSQFVLQNGYDAIIYCDGAGPAASVFVVDKPQFTNVLVTGNLSVEGVTTISGSLTVPSNLTVNGALSVVGNQTIGGTLSVTGNTTFLAGAETIWYPPGNTRDFEARAVATADGYALEFGSGSFGVTGLVMDENGRIGVATLTPSTIFDIRPANSVIQMSVTQQVLVAGNNNGGAIYFGGDIAGGVNIPTAAIETSWGGATNPQISIGVIRDAIKANILMNSAGDTYIRNGSTVYLSATPGGVGVNTASPVSMFHVDGGRSRFTSNNENFAICLEYPGQAVTYLGTNSSGQFQVSNQGGPALMTIDQSGNANITGSLGTGGSLTVNGNASVAGSLSSGSFSTGTLGAGATTVSGLTVNGNASVIGSLGAASLNISGNGTISGSLNTGSLSTGGTLSAGAATVSSLTSSGQIWAQGGGFKFPDNTVQTTAAVASAPPPGGITSIHFTSVSSGQLPVDMTAGAGNFDLSSSGGGVVTQISALVNGPKYTVGYSSDVRLKQNIEPLAGGMSVIDRIRPIRGEWNGLCGKPKGEKLIGVVAQELRQVIPEAVFPFPPAKLQAEDAEETELLSFEPMAITAHLVLACQQLEAEIRRLREERGR